jgi:hypothetical protein
MTFDDIFIASSEHLFGVFRLSPFDFGKGIKQLLHHALLLSCLFLLLLEEGACLLQIY